MEVPFLNLRAQYESLKSELLDRIIQAIESTAFISGPFVSAFEKEFADYCNCKYAIGVGSGTEALWLALTALNIGPGDEVITVPNTFIATAEAISQTGATPIFVDVDEKTYTMDPRKLRHAITARTKAILPVHLYGQMADMDEIMTIANKNDLFVIEDACQAHGAEYNGRRAGSIGHAGCFSFYPGKNLGAYGDAGAVVTNNAKLAEHVLRLRDHGQMVKYEHQLIGWNARMDEIQGAVLSVKLKYLEKWNESRRKVAEFYNSFLHDVREITLPVEAPYARHVYHIYAARTAKRDSLIEYLGKQSIQCGIHYPIPIHFQQAYAHLKIQRGAFPIAEKVSEEVVSLPMCPELNRQQLEKVVSDIRQFFGYDSPFTNLRRNT